MRQRYLRWRARWRLGRLRYYLLFRFFGLRWVIVGEPHTLGEASWWPALLFCKVLGHLDDGSFYHDGPFCGRCLAALFVDPPPPRTHLDVIFDLIKDE